MWILCGIVVASASEPPWLGEATTRGNSPVQLRLRAGPDEALVELWWHAFQTTTIEQVLPIVGCEHPSLAQGVARIEGRCRGIRAEVASRHPVYDYTEQDLLRCAVGDAAAWCRLPFTGWFEVSAPVAPATAR